MRRFKLHRLEDQSGVSGVGIIAEGVQFKTGKCVLSWLTAHSSLGLYDDVTTLMAIHGHGGKTLIEWVDQ